MRRIDNYDKVQASGGFERLAPGGYIITILSAEDVPDKEYLRIVYDIAEGPEAGRFKGEDPENDYRHSFVRSYRTEKALGMFKAFTNAVEASNPKYKWDFKEETLKGKKLGIVLGYEQYEANDGTIKERARITACKSADAIRNGDFAIPELKKLEVRQDETPQGFTPMDEDLPF